MEPLFGAAYAAPNKGTTILYWFRSPKTVLKPPVNGKIQVVFKAFECFLSAFQVKFNFQGLFKTVLYIQVLFKPVWTLKKNDDIIARILIISLTHLSRMNFPISIGRTSLFSNFRGIWWNFSFLLKWLYSILKPLTTLFVNVWLEYTGWSSKFPKS